MLWKRVLAALASLMMVALSPPAVPALSPQPDVSISESDIAFSNDFPQSGESVGINVTAHNIGDLASGVVTVRFYIDGLPYPPDRTIANIEPNSTGEASTTWLATAPKTYTIHVVLECAIDTNSANNEASRTITVSVPGGVLTVNATLDPPSCRPSHQLFINGTVRLAGAPVVGASVTVTIKPSGPTGTATTDAGGAFSVNLTAPGAGGSYEVETTATSGHQRGTDSDTLTVVVPDLLIVSLTFSTANATEGDMVRIVAVVRNAGGDVAGEVEVGFYRDDSRIGVRSARALGPGNQTEVEMKWTAEKGTHEMRAVADPDGKVAEMDEGNNGLSRPLTVKSRAGGGEGGGGGLLVAAAVAAVVIAALAALVVIRRRRRTG